MSKLITNTIRHTGGSADNITLDNSQNVTAEANLTVDGNLTVSGTSTISGYNSTSSRNSQNLVINGSMIIAQRGTSNTSDQQGYQTVDRFKLGWSGADAIIEQHQGTLTSSDTGPWEAGFRKAWKMVNGNQSSGAGAADLAYLYHFIEAQDIAGSGWDYTNASSKLTLSFWIKSNIAQNFYGYVKTQDGTAQLLTFETTALTANTWKKVTVSIPGHANLQFDNNADAGLQIAWMPFFGTDYTTSGKTLNAWAAYSGSDRSPDNTSTWWTTNDAEFWLTGVQLEVGDTATDFEHRSYGDELARCQRYCQKVMSLVNVGASSVTMNMRTPLFCQMRSTPSISLTGTTMNFGDQVAVSDTTTSTPAASSYTNNEISLSMQCGGFDNLTAYRVYRHEPSGSNDAILLLSAEL